jgi:hypothetical protein
MALMTDALAREPWRSGKWIKMRLGFYQMVDVVLCHLTGYSYFLISDSNLPFSAFHLVNIFVINFMYAYSICEV